MRILLNVTSAVALVVCAHAQNLSAEVVSRAEPDECFNALGAPYIPYAGGCAKGLTDKRNQTYTWSMTKSEVNDKVWIGTGANISCLGAAAAGSGPIFVPFTFVCEADLSQYEGLPPFLRLPYGDWRPPQVQVYDPDTGQTNDASPSSLLVRGTMGFRAAGAAGNRVLFAGPRLIGFGVNWFLYDAETCEFLTAWTTLQHANVRKMVTYEGQLYIAVQNTLGGGGAVLRYTGDPGNPFETVGTVDADAANLAVHEGRLLCTTWGNSEQSSLIGFLNMGSGAVPGVWRSPVIPASGLRWWHQFFWNKVFSVDEYEVDPEIAKVYLLGDIASFGPYAYFGSMHPPSLTYRAIVSAYGETAATAESEDKAFRRSAVFRMRFDGGSPEVELLYGETQLEVYDGAVWTPTPNGLGAPAYGASGFDNTDNVYFWIATVFQGRLYCGTLDYPGDEIEAPGADLWCFPDTSSPASLVNGDGWGNAHNIGYRAVVSCPDVLYLGTANPSNLSPLGGWHLLCLTPDRN